MCAYSYLLKVTTLSSKPVQHSFKIWKCVV